MSFEDSKLYAVLTSKTSTLDDITKALNDTPIDLRSSTGDTFVHIACKKSELLTGGQAVWRHLLSKKIILQRNADGVSGLDAMVDNIDSEIINAVLTEHLQQLTKSGELEEFLLSAVLSGKLGFLVARAGKDEATQEIMKRVQAVEEDLRTAHQEIRLCGDSRKVASLLSKRKLVEVADLCGIPALHLALVHGCEPVVEELIKRFPEAVNLTDNMGRTALHYAVSMRSEEGNQITQLLTEAKADANIKDLQGRDVAVYRENPLDMEAFMKNYREMLGKRESEERMHRVHNAVTEGDLRSVKMALERREHAVVKDASQMTPLHKAIAMKNQEICQWIIEQFPAALNVVGLKGLTPMHIAAAVDTNVYEMIKKAGGDDTIKDEQGHDPSYYAANAQHLPLNLTVLKDDLVRGSPSRPVSAAATTPVPAKPASAAKPQTGNPQSTTSKAPPTEKTAASSPQTLDAKYIADVLGASLTVALAELVEKRPWDPIEYLAQWLYKHKNNHDRKAKLIEAVKNAEIEEKKKKLEAETRVRRRKEAAELKKKAEEERLQTEEATRKQKETEELQKKAKESLQLAQAPELATVTEVSEEPADNTTVVTKPEVEKNSEGMTALQELVTSGGDDNAVKELLSNPTVSQHIGERNAVGKTARDIADSLGMTSLVAALDEHVVELFRKENSTATNKLIEDGYITESLANEILKNDLPESAKEILGAATDMNSRVTELHSLIIKSDEVRDVKQIMDRKALALARNTTNGCSALHLAILFEKNDIATYLLEQFPTAAQSCDNFNRTPLHYANALDEELREQFTSLFAKTQHQIVDCKGRAPSEFTTESEEINEVKTALQQQHQSEADETTGTAEEPAAEEPAAATEQEAPAE